MKISSVMLVLVGIAIGLVISQSGNQFVHDAEAARKASSSPTQPLANREV